MSTVGARRGMYLNARRVAPGLLPLSLVDQGAQPSPIRAKVGGVKLAVDVAAAPPSTTKATSFCAQATAQWRIPDALQL